MSIAAPMSRSRHKALSIFVAVQCCLTLSLRWSTAAETPSVAKPCYLRTGDRVVFYGDSITEQAHYTRPVETYLRTRCPDLNVTFINSGWGGDRAWGGEGGALAQRLQRDVLAHKPTVVTVLLGMNDGYYTNFDPTAVTAFKGSLEELIDTLTHALPHVRITFIGSSPYDNVTPGDQPDWEKGIARGYNSVVSQYSAAAREVADQHGLVFVDMNEPLVQLLKQLQATKPKLARELIADRIHPGPAAGLVMAARLLAAWNVPTSGHEIDIDGKAATGKLHVRQSIPLPFPFDRNDRLTNLVRETSPDLQQLTDDTLRVTDLPFARASVAIDGEEVGVFSAERLAAGVNLAEFDSPLSRQGAEIAKLIDLRNRVHFTRWRNLEFSFAKDIPANVKQAATELAALEQDLAALEATAARPKTHTIEIIATEQ